MEDLDAASVTDVKQFFKTFTRPTTQWWRWWAI